MKPVLLFARPLARSRCVRSVGTRSEQFIGLEARHGAFNYKPIPVVLSRASGVYAWDVDGRQYIDCLSAYSAVNQGHCHPRLQRALTAQAARLTLTSRAFYNDQLGPYEAYATQLLGMDRLLPMNSGVEAAETGLKLARRWGYDVKGVPHDRAVVLVAHGNFFGRTIAAVSASDDPDAYGGYGPLLGGFEKVRYGDAAALEGALAANPHIVAFMVEPVQGEAGVVVPPPGYLRAAREACDRHGVLLMVDEIQTGLGRAGSLLACTRPGELAGGVRPDILLLGKALSGGMLPASAVLARHDVMLTVKPGQHGSTYGGNPLACAVAAEALRVIVDERLPENSAARGEQWRAGMRDIAAAHPGLFPPPGAAARGVGLMNALVVRDDARDRTGQRLSAWDLCLALAHAGDLLPGGAPGLLAKPTHGTVVRLTPPLVITPEQTDAALRVLAGVVDVLAAGRRAPGPAP